MMKNRFYWLIIATVIALVSVVFFSACGNDDKDEPSNNSFAAIEKEIVGDYFYATDDNKLMGLFLTKDHKGVLIDHLQIKDEISLWQVIRVDPDGVAIIKVFVSREYKEWEYYPKTHKIVASWERYYRIGFLKSNN